MLSRNEIKFLQSLEQKKYRQEHNLAFIEGKRLILECLQSAYKIKEIFVTEKFSKNNSSFLKKLGEKQIPINTCSEKDMDRISPSKNPQGAAATILLRPSDNDFIMNEHILYLDGISDPGNLGTLFRTASWFGITQILLSRDCADPWNSKVIRSAAGAHFHIDFHFADVETMKAKINDHELIGAVTNGVKISDIQLLKKNWILVLGSEAHGISKEFSSILNHKLTIPGTGKPESLNVAVAGGIILNELIKAEA